jgi:hypothetical protein
MKTRSEKWCGIFNIEFCIKISLKGCPCMVQYLQRFFVTAASNFIVAMEYCNTIAHSRYEEMTAIIVAYIINHILVFANLHTTR